MNKDILKGSWKELAGKAKQKWGKFTDNDLTRIAGSYEELSGSIQKAYGYQKDQADKEIDAFLKDNEKEDTRS